MSGKRACMLCIVGLVLLSTGYFILERDGISPCVPAWADPIPASVFRAQLPPAPFPKLAQEMRPPSYFRVRSLLVYSRHPGPWRVWKGGCGPHFWARIRLIWLIRLIRRVFQNVRFGATLQRCSLFLRKVTLWYNVALIFSWTSQLNTYF